jgi:hypothetical protein
LRRCSFCGFSSHISSGHDNAIETLANTSTAVLEQQGKDILCRLATNPQKYEVASSDFQIIEAAPCLSSQRGTTPGTLKAIRAGMKIELGQIKGSPGRNLFALLLQEQGTINRLGLKGQGKALFQWALSISLGTVTYVRGADPPGEALALIVQAKPKPQSPSKPAPAANNQVAAENQNPLRPPLPQFLAKLEEGMSANAAAKRKFTYHSPLAEVHAQANRPYVGVAESLGDFEVTIPVQIRISDMSEFLVMYSQFSSSKRARKDGDQDVSSSVVMELDDDLGKGDEDSNEKNA